MKRCTKCGIPKLSEEFCLNSSSLDGLQSWCKECKNEHRAPLIQGSPVFEKCCTRCSVTKSGLDFSLNREDDPSYGIQAWCKECMNKYHKERPKKKSVADLVWERQQREQIKQDKYEALKHAKPKI